MTLRDSLQAYHSKVRSPTFWPALPSPAGPRSVAAITRAGGCDLVPSKASLEELSNLKARLLQSAEGNQLAAVSERDWRYAPWVFWHEGDQVAADERIVHAYLERAAARKSPAWLLTLISAFLACYPKDSRTLAPISDSIRRLLELGRWPSLSPWADRHRRWKLFDGSAGPACVAKHVLESNGVVKGLRSIGLDIAFTHAEPFNFVASAYCAAMAIGQETLRSGKAPSLDTIDRLVEWSLPSPLQPGGTRYPQHVGELADALLVPWKTRPASEPVKQQVTRFLMQQVGDPRTDSAAWQRVDSGTKGILLNWVAGKSLEQYFELLSRSADEISQFRRKFWMAYYEAGAIAEAWFALGPDAQRPTQQRSQGGMAREYAELAGAQDRKQSVLIIVLGRFTIAEWSHNGKCRFWLSLDSHAPKLYRASYHADDLRTLCRHEQTHDQSIEGRWQTLISNYIGANTGVGIPPDSWK